MNGLSKNDGNINDKSDSESEILGSREAGSGWLYQTIEIFELRHCFTKLIFAWCIFLKTGVAVAKYLVHLFFFFSNYPKAQIKERWKFENVRFKTWCVYILPHISTERQNYTEEIVERRSNKKARRSPDSATSKTSSGVDTEFHDSTREVYG